jgi:SSS family solute:Na+ symporter
MTLLPSGLLGLVFVALIAAIIASMGSKINSIATIFTIDVFKTVYKNTSERTLVIVGRLTAITALGIAMVTAQPLLGSFDQAFQYIQEFTGFFTPGIVVIFLLGMFWKRATEAGALTAGVASVALSYIYSNKWPYILAFDALGHIPFLNRMGYVFLICLGSAVIVSLMQKPKPQSTTIELTGIDYSTSKSFVIASAAVIAILIALYATWW